jgi:hypothetical protein
MYKHFLSVWMSGKMRGRGGNEKKVYFFNNLNGKI